MRGCMHRWDEWVPPLRLRKYDEDTLKRQAELQKGTGKDGAGSGPSKSKATKAAGDGAISTSTRGVRGKAEPRGTKRGRDDVGSFRESEESDLTLWV